MRKKREKTEEEKVRLVPPITPQMLEENEAYQKDLRQLFGVGVPDIKQQMLVRNRLVVEENKQLLSALLTQLKNTVSISNRYADLQEIIKLKAEETADILAEIGEFETAAKFTLNQRKKQLFKSYQKAMEMDDNDWCDHPKYYLVENGKPGEKHANYFREKDIFSPKHGRIVSIIRCNLCEFRNIRPLPDDLARASAARAEIRRQHNSNK